ncbi:MAG: hypothetical protein NZ656_09700 [Nitrospinaceae bacterium]|nr:hypothetical protein [Nitrospinaceae bacterium]
MKIIAKLLVISSLILGSAVYEAAAQGVPTEGLVRIKGKATIKYAGIFRAGSPERRIAMDKALVSCIDRYCSMLEPIRYKIFVKHALSTVEKNPAPYVGAITIVKEHTDKTTKTFDIIVEAEVNATKLNALLEAMLPKSTLKEGDAVLAFVAMAREIAAKKIFDDEVRKFEVLEEEEERIIKEAKKLGLDGLSLEDHVKKELAKAREKIEGGDRLKRNNIDENRVFSVGSLDAGIAKVFTEAKFEVFQGGDIEIDLENVKKDFAKDGQASVGSLKQARTQCGEAETQFLMVATLDIFLPSIDKATGKPAVTCAVNAQVYQLKKRGKFVTGIVKASMAGDPFVGLGPNDNVAKQNAINLAAKCTAEMLRDQLRAKGLTP